MQFTDTDSDILQSSKLTSGSIMMDYHAYNIVEIRSSAKAAIQIM